MTHVQVDPTYTTPIGTVPQVLNGTSGHVALYDFSTANRSYEDRVAAVSAVASICYQSPKSLGSISLFNRLQAESAGLPSSSYEFVPVLLSFAQQCAIESYCSDISPEALHIYKFGELLPRYSDDTAYLLTNLRALIHDVGESESFRYFNTDPDELELIRSNFKVFHFNVDLSTRSQMVRHRVSWQELSRRYVSGSKSPFEFYVSPKMQVVESGSNRSLATQDLIDLCTAHYDIAIASGVKPEEARRILPQAMLTQIWGAFQTSQLEAFFALRLDSHAQAEIRQVATAMKSLLEQPCNS